MIKGILNWLYSGTWIKFVNVENMYSFRIHIDHLHLDYSLTSFPQTNVVYSRNKSLVN